MLKFIESCENRRIAYHYTRADNPTVIFCGGYMSDMEGTKALYLEKVCSELGLSYIRFDYSGHGSSSTEFVDGTIGKWKADALAIIDQIAIGELIIVGSSMGGWIGLLVSLERKERIRAFIGIASAPDFTRELMWDKFSPEMRETLKRDGVYLEPSDYSDEPYKVTYDLIKEGEKHCILDKVIDLKCPARLFHGLKDYDVPSTTSMRIAEKLTSDDVVIRYNKNGDHRLSGDEDLSRLKQALIELA